MLPHVRIALLALPAAWLCTTRLPAQSLNVTNAQMSTQSALNGLAPLVAAARRTTWIGYTVAAIEKVHGDWNPNSPVYLEGNRSDDSSHTSSGTAQSGDVAILLRVTNAVVEKVRIEPPARALDAGGLPFVMATAVSSADSIRLLTAVARDSTVRSVQESALLAIGSHRAPDATAALVSFTDAGNPEQLRERAAFWLAVQRGHEGFVALQQLARQSSAAEAASFREKLVFDFFVSKDPGGVAELVRMAHDDPAPGVRRQAQFWMANKGGKQVAGNLAEQASNDPEAAVRKSAVFALSRLPQSDGTPRLIELARHSKDPAVRRQAIFWLGQSHDPRALEYLTTLLQ